jgi:hypothetical protein
MSTHYLWSRPQDLAFERIVGGSPRRRHHVRFWRAPGPPDSERSAWAGAATFDVGVGVSRFTGEVMHHIDPNVDSEREKLIGDLAAAGWLEDVRRIDGFTVPRRARNGGGDWYETDGALTLGILRRPAVPVPSGARSKAYSSSGREPARSSDRS